MEYKKETLEFLKENLKETLKVYALNEAQLRAAYLVYTTTQLRGGKLDQISAQHTQAKQNKVALEDKIKYLREVIAEIKDGRFSV